MEYWKHQLKGIENGLRNNYYGLFFEVGTGKTATLIGILRAIFNFKSQVLPTVIISPLVTLHNWKNEWAKFSKIQPQDVVVLEGTGRKKLDTFLKHAAKPGKIFILNYEALLHKELYEAILKWAPRVLVCDESHYIKNPTSQRTKKIMKIAELAEYRYILSGTPILNSPFDIFSQMYVLDLGKRFGTKFHFFKLKYFYDKNAGMPSHKHFPLWLPKSGSIEDINKLINECTMHVKKSECLDLPPLVREEIPVEMSKEQLKHYESLKLEFISYINDAACVASLAITKALRLQQVLSGHMPLDNEQIYSFKENPRLEALQELVELHKDNSKIIIWACFKKNHEEISRMLDRINVKHVFLTGEQNLQEKQASMVAFETDPSVRVCVGNQSVGIGVNLISSNLSIYYSRSFNMGHDEQSMARNYRAGSEMHNSITRIDLVTPNTIDEKILQALKNKREISAQLLKEVAKEI